ncbi:MAG: hypothetical protein O3A46_08185 [Candidatus Poribacteria bacterium]|nr:hypothetical protein [Candidatus Poribacteria bacterium]
MRERANHDGNKLAIAYSRWMIFSVIASVIPIVLSIVWTVGRTGSLPPFESWWAGGELLLVTTGLTAGGLGQTIGTRETRALQKILVGGSCFVTALVAIGWFADIHTSMLSHQTVDQEAITIGSCWIFLIGLVEAAISIYVTRED